MFAACHYSLSKCYSIKKFQKKASENFEPHIARNPLNEETIDWLTGELIIVERVDGTDYRQQNETDRYNFGGRHMATHELLHFRWLLFVVVLMQHEVLSGN